jgi:hypothetical protein
MRGALAKGCCKTEISMGQRGLGGPNPFAGTMGCVRRLQTRNVATYGAATFLLLFWFTASEVDSRLLGMAAEGAAEQTIALSEEVATDLRQAKKRGGL